MRSSTKPYDVHFWVQSGHSSGQSPLLLLPDLPVATIKGVVKTPVIVACAGAAHRLTFDYVAILPRHLEHVPLIARCIPDLRIVIDHLGKPPIVTKKFEPWSSLLARAARMPNVFAKVTGLDIDDASNWTAADIAPYVDRALDLFGPERLMFGSDWPVANLRGGYNKVWRETNEALARLSRDERDLILGGTALEFYRLPVRCDHER